MRCVSRRTAVTSQPGELPRPMGMNTTFRRSALLLLALVAAFVGGWATLSPDGFYQSFPGFGLHWVAQDGPFNEHLIRDVGGLYLGLGAASVAAVFARTATASRVVGLNWSLFNVLHLGYHILHLEGSVLDKVGNVVGLGATLLFGLILLLPAHAVQATPIPEEAAR
jgi:hypothetical protein